MGENLVEGGDMIGEKLAEGGEERVGLIEGREIGASSDGGGDGGGELCADVGLFGGRNTEARACAGAGAGAGA